MSNSKRMKKSALILCAFLILVCALCWIYLSTGSYPAHEDAVAAMAHTDIYTVTKYDDGTLAFVPKEPVVGLIFYPGGKVESQAYAPLMAAFAREGVLCILQDFPFDLAVFDVSAAEGIPEQYPEIDRWYLAGHSLGGAMAASYVASHTDEYEGLFLLASYSTKDLMQSGLEVVSLYGSEDLVLNMEKYEEYRSNLPETSLEYMIPGGCHAYFGSYGPQKGDGIPAITQEEQIAITAEQCLSVMERS